MWPTPRHVGQTTWSPKKLSQPPPPALREGPYDEWLCWRTGANDGSSWWFIDVAWLSNSAMLLIIHALRLIYSTLEIHFCFCLQYFPLFTLSDDWSHDFNDGITKNCKGPKGDITRAASFVHERTYVYIFSVYTAEIILEALKKCCWKVQPPE